MEQLKTDVLIIGGGGAGLRAAIEARESGAGVLVLSKSVLGKAHTAMAEGGIAAATTSSATGSASSSSFSRPIVAGWSWRPPKVARRKLLLQLN